MPHFPAPVLKSKSGRRRRGPPVGFKTAVVLDLEQVRSLKAIRGLNHGSLLGELAVLLRRDMPQRLAELERKATAHHRHELAQRAHALAGSCATLGGRQMQAAALALERTAASGDWLLIQSRLALLADAWIQLDRALQAQQREEPS